MVCSAGLPGDGFVCPFAAVFRRAKLGNDHTDVFHFCVEWPRFLVGFARCTGAAYAVVMARTGDQCLRFSRFFGVFGAVDPGGAGVFLIFSMVFNSERGSPISAGRQGMQAVAVLKSVDVAAHRFEGYAVAVRRGKNLKKGKQAATGGQGKRLVVAAKVEVVEGMAFIKQETMIQKGVFKRFFLSKTGIRVARSGWDHPLVNIDLGAGR